MYHFTHTGYGSLVRVEAGGKHTVLNKFGYRIAPYGQSVVEYGEREEWHDITVTHGVLQDSGYEYYRGDEMFVPSSPLRLTCKHESPRLGGRD